MMAKMFYTLDEAKAALNKNEEEIKQLAREGRLREFRDGPRLMFKADQVETLKSELGGGVGGDRVDLGVSDTGAPIGLVDSRSASGTGISLVDTDARGGTGSGLSGSGLSNLSPGGSGSGSGMPLKEDTALAADLGLSGSVGGMPSPGRGGSRTGSGINVLGGTEEHEVIDPSAQTNISASVHDQVNLEGVGSGSGLLDLTRESDDTSLGAELLDEIAPGGTKGGTRVGPADSGSGTATVPAFGTAARGRTAGPMVVEQADPMAAAFGGAALAGAIVLLLGGLSLGSAVVGTKVSLLSFLEKPNAFLVVAGGGAVLAIIFFVIGLVVGKSR